MAGREFITRMPRLQPGAEPTSRDVTELSRQVSQLSEQVSAEVRPQMSSIFIDAEHGTGEPVALVAEQVNGVVHGLGRKYRGWSVASVDEAAMVFEASDAYLTAQGITVDKTIYIPLRTTVSCNVKLLVW